MANVQNLRPDTRRPNYKPGEEAREMGRRGGLASVAVRRRKKAVREFAQIIADAPITSEKLKETLSKNGIKGKEATNAAALAFRIMMEGIKGNPRMAQMALDLLGESAAKKVELTGAGGQPLQVERKNPFEGMSIDEIRRLAGLDPE